MTERMKSPHFSAKTAWNRRANPLSTLLTELRDRGRALFDLTESNPTKCGLGGGDEQVQLLGNSRGALYDPLPLGHLEARRAIRDYYRDRGLSIDVSRIALSASTSEAYGWLFKLLAERGDAVLVPKPSYPLFDYLADLEEVRLVPYPLLREERFRVDLSALESAIDERTRAILLVHPNNPTGTFVRREDALALETIAQQHGLALIVDEVFGDYAWDALPEDRLPSFVGDRKALTFVLSGLSKVCALPQLKLAWTIALGPDEIVDEAMGRLEVIADTYLSVSTPVQRALPEILAARGPIQARIRSRVAKNLAKLDAMLGDDSAVRRLASDGGWYAILEVPRTRDEDGWVDVLVREDSVIVHPGYYFDLDREGYLVVSLLPEEASFTIAIERVMRRLHA